MPAKKIKAKKMTTAHKPVRSGEVPATKAMLDEMEQKLTHEMTSFKLEVNARFNQVDARFNQVDSRFDQLESKFDQLEFKVDSKIETVLAAIHRVGLVVEEQNARNKFVLDGYASLNDRLENLERRDEEIDL